MDEQLSHFGLIDDEEILLDLAALEIAAADHDGVDLDPAIEMLSEMVDQVAATGADARTPMEQVEVLRAVLAGEFGFEGDRETYDDPANADLIRVIERRRGLPVSLAILYAGVARRLGWAADPLDIPGHVLLRVGPDLVIDPFNGGAVVTADRIQALLRLAPDQPGRPRRITPEVMSNRGTLVRLVLNQATRAESGGDKARALLLYRRITAIAPGTTIGWWERARLELDEKDVTGARASLGAMFEVTRDPIEREQISATLEAISGHA